MEGAAEFAIVARRRRDAILPERLRRIASYVVESDGRAELICPAFLSRRTFDAMALGGPVGGGWTLGRPSTMRFVLRGDGDPATMVGRWARPGRRMRPSWDLALTNGDTISITRGHTVDRPGVEATYSGTGLSIALGRESDATVFVDGVFGGTVVEALVASIVCLVTDPKAEFE